MFVAWLASPASAITAGFALPKATVAISATQIKELRATRLLLERADHDYQGHRAAAVKELTIAIHALEHRLPHSLQNRLPANVHGPGNHEQQQVSDAQLRQAIQGLGTIKAQLSTSNGQHAITASQAIDAAVKHLQIALTIK